MSVTWDGRTRSLLLFSFTVTTEELSLHTKYPQTTQYKQLYTEKMSSDWLGHKHKKKCYLSLRTERLQDGKSARERLFSDLHAHCPRGLPTWAPFLHPQHGHGSFLA